MLPIAGMLGIPGMVGDFTTAGIDAAVPILGIDGTAGIADTFPTAAGDCEEAGGATGDLLGTDAEGGSF